MNIHPAYLAGLIDGEGSIIIAKQLTHSTRTGHHYSVQVKISNNCKEVLEDVRAAYGGNLHLNRNRPKYMKKLHDNWQFTIVAKEAQRLLHAIAPFLRIKEEQCSLALELLGRTHYTGLPLSNAEWQLREVMYQKMKALNSRYDGRVADLPSMA